MDTLIIVLLDDDLAYMEMLASYINASSYRNRLELKTFTLKSALDTYLEVSNKFDILVVNAEMFDARLKSLSHSSCIVLLGEGNAEALESEADVIIKYQPLNLLLDRLLAIYEDYYAIGLRKSRSPQVISVYSAVGGTGKTTVAANLSKLLAFLDHKVFYLNLEQVPSVSMFPVSEGNQNFAQFLYYIQIQADKLANKLDHLKSYDSISQVHYFEPLTSLADLEAMSGGTVEDLIAALTKQSDYDFVIIDLDHSLHERNIRALSLSRHIIWLVIDDLNNNHKTAAVLRELKSRFTAASAVWLDNIHFLMNKYTGKVSNDFTSRDIRVSGHLPYVPQWKSVTMVEQLLSENAFHGHLLQWFYSVKELSRL